MNGFFTVLGRDVGLAYAQGGAALLAVAFFVVTVTLFPLGIGPGSEILGRVSAGVVWTAALLAALLSLDRMFQADLEDGSLDLLALSPVPMALIVLAKCAAHWITTGLPLIIAAPVLAILMQMPIEGLPVLLASMALGTPALSLLGGIGAALTVGLRRGGVLLSLLVLPLYIPVLIFAVAAIDASIGGSAARPHLLLLAAVTLVSRVVAPIAGAAAIRLALE